MSVPEAKTAGYRREPIAIVGMSCRFPGASNLAEYWDLLVSGRDAISQIPPERFDSRLFVHAKPQQTGKIVANAGGFLTDIDGFDADFFGISPREASRMDPQQRLLLEVAWEALEHAGQVPSRLLGSKTAVYVGVSANDYIRMQYDDVQSVNAYTNSGGAGSIAANRISYFFGFHGPSMAVDTACSSSLVALHQACRELWHGDCEMALVGGASLLLRPGPFVGFCQAAMLSPTGRCHAFDAAADGYVRAEGVGMAVLKPLTRALADRDPIVATIVGTGVNADGRTSGMFQPSAAAQADLLTAVYAEAGASPADVCYVEAHGTGTKAGDPAECKALGTVLGKAAGRAAPLKIGSVKTNIGHLESASGMAGLIKAAASVQRRTLPASRLNAPNPEIPFAELNLAVQTECEEMDPKLTQPLLGVDSFGFGGINAHAIVGAPPAVEPLSERPRAEHHLLLLSAKSEQALHANARVWADYLGGCPEASLTDICYTAARRREQLPYRLALAAADVQSMAARLREYTDGGRCEAVIGHGTPKKVAFLFSGNGSQWLGMGEKLLADAECRSVIDSMDEIWRPLASWSLVDVLAGAEALPLSRTEFAQPALFAVQTVIWRYLEKRGARPDAVCGHSVGELAAAHAAGVLSLGQALRVVYRRSLAQGRTAGKGQMAALGLSRQEAEGLLATCDGVEIGAINSPRSVTIAGPLDALSTLGWEVQERGRFFRALDIDYPFHSAAMDELKDEVLTELADLTPASGNIPFVSGTFGSRCEGHELTGAYWWDNLRQPVQFDAAIGELIAEGFELFVELGPHPILASYVRESLHARRSAGVVLETLRRGKAEPAQLLAALGGCHANGLAVDLDAVFSEGSTVGELPHYAFQRESFWHEPHQQPLEHPLLGPQQIDAGPTPAWLRTVDAGAPEFLTDHAVHGVPVFPATAYLEMAVAALRQNQVAAFVELKDVAIPKALVLGDELSVKLRTQWSVSGDSRVVIASRRVQQEREAAWTRHFQATARVAGWLTAEPWFSAAAIVRSIDDSRVASLYTTASRLGLNYGPRFQTVKQLGTVTGEETCVVGRVMLPEVDADDQDYHIHPALLDGCFQLGLSLVGEHTQQSYLPVQAERVCVFGGGGAEYLCTARVQRVTASTVVVDLQMIDTQDRVAVQVDGLLLHAAAVGPKQRDELFSVAWESVPWPAAVVPSSQKRPSLPLAPVTADSVHQANLLRLNELMALYLAEAIERLLAQPAFELADLLAETAAAWHPMLQPWLELLCQHELLRLTDGGYAFCPSRTPATKQWRVLCRELADYHAELLLTATVGDALDDMLKHGVAVPAVLREVETTVAHYLHGAPSCQAGRRQLLSMLAQAVAQCPPTRPLRILELSNGIAELAPSVSGLNQAHIEYVVAAVSETDLAGVKDRLHGQGMTGGERTAKIPVQMLNAAGPEDSTGVFDVIVAHHALQRLGTFEEAQERLRRWLLPNGQLAVVLGHESLLDMFLFNQGMPFHAVPPPNDDTFVCHACDGQRLLLANGEEAVTNESLHLEPLSPPKTWLVLRDDAPEAGECALGEKLQLLLENCGHRVFTASAGSGAFKKRAEGDYVVAPGDEGWRRLFGAIGGDGVEDVVYLWSLNNATLSSASGESELTAAELACTSLLSLLQTWSTERRWMPKRLWLVTNRAMAVDASVQLAPEQGLLWGLGRVMMNEHPELETRLIDLQQLSDQGDVDKLAALLSAPDEERESVVYGDLRLAPRIDLASTSFADETKTVRLANDRKRHELYWEGMALPQPGPGQIVVTVHAAGLNFRDVLWAMGMLPPDAFADGYAGEGFGLECAGVVTAIGEGVDGFSIGDEVIAFAAQALASHVVVDADLVAAKPTGCSFAAAASIPTVFFTAYHAIHHLARLAPGERILIHGAAGGVGLAAIQVAQGVGADIVATAGTEAKRAYLRRFGVQHCFDSRSCGFADALRAELPDGVDVVLNSLAGEAMERGMEVLRSGGRFVEIGKRDIYANNPLSLRPFRRNISYFAMDADQLLLQQRDLANAQFAALLTRFEHGDYRPLPHRVFPAQEVASAFAHLQRAEHIGKVVIALNDRPKQGRVCPEPLVLRADARYVVIGGLGGFGGALAQWLVDRGARHLLLAGRREADMERIASWAKDRGVDIRYQQADVTKETDVIALYEAAGENMPVAAVFHAAMVLEDGAAAAMDENQFTRVLRPKMWGAWWLHRHCPQTLEHFVLFSSGATLIGNPGQANYVAANVFLEQLAALRRSQGKPALAVSWGAIADVGYLADKPELLATLEKRIGLAAMTADDALEHLGQLMVGTRHHVAVAAMDWQSWAASSPAAKAPKFGRVRGNSDGLRREVNAREQLLALPKVERRAWVLEQVCAIMGDVLRRAPERIDTRRPITELGLDSLLGMDLAMRMERELGVEPPMMRLLQGPSLEELADEMLRQLLPDEDGSED